MFRGDLVGGSEPFLRTEAGIGNADTDIIEQRFLYEPDKSANYKRFLNGTLHDDAPGRLAVDDGVLYFGVAQRPYRYEPLDPNGQHPDLVTDDGVFVAGLSRGTILLLKPGGLYAVRAERGRATTHFVVAANSRMTGSVTDADGMFVSFDDGRIVYVTAGLSSARVFNAPCPVSQVAHDPRMIYAICRRETRDDMFAFAR
ncbi:MAG: hypothetical protein M3N49_07505 [Candidatus Eremiobacteraeota bacterium]|nr:hypothetical protein [Candidatus Eremiobacteraeota bacterium]